MKSIITVIFLFFTIVIYAQEIEYDGSFYTVKKGLIYKNGEDVTNALSKEQQSEIRAAFIEKQAEEKAAEIVEKELKKAEKEQRKLEKKQRKAERELKKKERAQEAFAKAEKRHEKSLKKYNRLLRKGKLSPNDVEDWKDKLEKEEKDMQKAKRKLKRA